MTEASDKLNIWALGKSRMTWSLLAQIIGSTKRMRWFGKVRHILINLPSWQKGVELGGLHSAEEAGEYQSGWAQSRSLCQRSVLEPREASSRVCSGIPEQHDSVGGQVGESGVLQSTPLPCSGWPKIAIRSSLLASLLPEPYSASHRPTYLGKNQTGRKCRFRLHNVSEFDPILSGIFRHFKSAKITEFFGGKGLTIRVYDKGEEKPLPKEWTMVLLQ